MSASLPLVDSPADLKPADFYTTISLFCLQKLRGFFSELVNLVKLVKIYKFTKRDEEWAKY
ncbi:MAG: hypothetical protein QXU75_08320 [Candidatus Methanomethylicaceae archaeon]